MMAVKIFVIMVLFTAGTSYCQDVLETLSDLRYCFMVSEDCPNKNITFWLYTRRTQQNPHQLKVNDLESIENAPFVQGAPFKILIHGYTGHKDYSPNTEIRPALFENGKFNIISVDYGPIAKEPCYLQAATKNVRVVGKCTAQMIDELIDKAGIRLEEFHVIGFSLGGQVAGFIGEHLKSGKLSHITGLDPAMPLFTTFDPDEKLDRSDAKFVDVLHTNAFVKGKFEPSGHVDFYANTGSRQPGCENEENFHSCNHARAPMYYAESINSKKGFWAVPLFCNERCDKQIMGYHVPNTARGIYIFKTNDEPPYAMGKEGIQ